MFRRQLKKCGMVLTLLMTMLASPVSGWAFCASPCAMHQEATKTDEDCCGQIAENHCPPKFGSAHQNSHYQAQTIALNNYGAKVQNGCFCFKDAPQQQSALGKQKIQPHQFYPIILPTPLNFTALSQTTAIAFFKPKVVYPARSSLSEIPPRAPPAL